MNYKHRHQNRLHGRYYFTGDYTALKVMLASVVFGWVVLNLNWAKLLPAKAEWVSPISDARVIEIEKKVPVKVPVYKAVSVADIVDYIWLKETTRGTNRNPDALHNYCKALGKSNEYGYSGMQGMQCFDSRQEARAWVTMWVSDHLKEFNGNVAKVLCHYNIGTVTESCPYAQGFAH